MNANAVTTIVEVKSWLVCIAPVDARSTLDGIVAMASQERSAPAVVTLEPDIAAAKAGDGDAFGRLIKKNQAAITSQMNRFSRNSVEVEELVHDVFVEAFLSLKSYRAQAPLIHWLRKIAVRVGYRFWKNRSQPKNCMPNIAEYDVITDEFEEESEKKAAIASDELYKLLSKLAPRDRLVLTLIYWDGCTVAEAGKLSGWTKTMVKVQAHRARKRLRKLIEESNQ